MGQFDLASALTTGCHTGLCFYGHPDSTVYSIQDQITFTLNLEDTIHVKTNLNGVAYVKCNCN